MGLIVMMVEGLEMIDDDDIIKSSRMCTKSMLLLSDECSHAPEKRVKVAVPVVFPIEQ